MVYRADAYANLGSQFDGADERVENRTLIVLGCYWSLPLTQFLAFAFSSRVERFSLAGGIELEKFRND